MNSDELRPVTVQEVVVDRVGLVALADSVDRGDVVEIEFEVNDPVLFEVGLVLVEREVAGPAPVTKSADGWLPRFRDGDVTLVGRELDDGRGGVGRSVSIVSYGDVLTAELWGPSRTVSLHQTGSDRGEVVAGPTVDVADLGDDTPERSKPSDGLEDLVSGLRFVEDPATSRIIDILVATSVGSDAILAAVQAGGGSAAYKAERESSVMVARNIVAKLNQTTSNNNIDTIFRLVGVYETGETLGETLNDPRAREILDQLADISDSKLDGVPVARRLVDADMVLLLTGPILDDDGEDFIAGKAFAVQHPIHSGSIDEAYVVFNPSQGFQSSVHEFGHLFGSRHDIVADSRISPFPRGHGFVFGTANGSFRTTMAYSDDPLCIPNGCPRIPYWSDPSATFGFPAVAIGDTLTADTADLVDVYTFYISNYELTKSQRLYRPSTGIWYIDGDDDGQWSNCTEDLCLGPYGVGANLQGAIHPEGHLTFMNPTTGQWSIDTNDNATDDGCAVDTCYTYTPISASADRPFFTPDGNIGIYQNGVWHIDLNGNGIWSGCVLDQCAIFGLGLDMPVMTPDGNIGVYRQSTGQWFLDSNANFTWDGCNIDTCVGAFGGPTDLPVINVDGQIGTYRPSTGQWFYDSNNNHLWDGCAIDYCAGNFGGTSDLAIDSVGSVAATTAPTT